MKGTDGGFWGGVALVVTVLVLAALAWWDGEAEDVEE
jgi:hypothetical protein